ncbi:MAG: ATP synthase F1 subunit delta [Bacteroidota bacterium]
MSQRTVATRYASALIEEAHDSDAVSTIDDDVDVLYTTLAENDELARVFTSPVLSAEQKERVVSALLPDHVSELMMRFLKLLIVKQRATLVTNILDAYRTLRNEQEGIVEVDVRSSHELDEDERDALVEALESLTGASVRLDISVDESLLGGLVIQVGDRVYDGSVHHKLEALRSRFHAPRPAAA